MKSNYDDFKMELSNVLDIIYENSDDYVKEVISNIADLLSDFNLECWNNLTSAKRIEYAETYIKNLKIDNSIKVVFE